MKIAVISPNTGHLHEIAKVIQAGFHTPVLIEGGKSRMREAAEQERPDIMIVEGMCCDVNELSQVEYVTSRFPNTAVVLICASSTPDFLINSMRAGVREVLSSPASPAALEAAINRLAAKMQSRLPTTSGKILAFISCKGGSGATFLATNLGNQLAEHKSVLLIDLNLQFGDALSFIYDGKPASTIADVAREMTRLDASFLAASAVHITPNFSVLAAPDDPSQSIEITPEHVDSIIALAANHYDFVLLDLSRSIDGVAVKALDRADTIFPVLQASLPGLRNAKKLIGVFRTLGYERDKLELIVNRYEKTGEIGLSEIERLLGALPVHTISNSYKPVTAAINHGGPLAVDARSNPVVRNLAEFAHELSPQQEQQQRNLMGRLFRRSVA
jgi:pilus assembly protein CpaE